MREFFTYGSVRGAARKGRSLPRLTEVRDQRAAVRNKSVKISCQSIDRTERFPCVRFATVVKPISDFRLLIFGLCAMLLALCLPAHAQQPAKVPRIGFLANTKLEN